MSLVCSIYAVGYFRRDEATGKISRAQLRHYYVLTPLFVGAMLLVPLADNLGVMWVAIESTTLASVLLVTFYNQKTSFEAGWKYIIIGSVGISLALFGTVFTYYCGRRPARTGNPRRHELVGAGGRGGQAQPSRPCGWRSSWCCSVTAPRPAWPRCTRGNRMPMRKRLFPRRLLLGAAFINCAIYAIMRFDVLAEKCLGHDFPGKLLMGFGIVSILVAAPFVLVQRNFRRLLAYSSIDHAGIMVAALGFGGKLGALGAVLHMLFHGVTKPLLFFCAGNVQQHYGTPYFRKVHGVMHTLPWTGGLFLVATLAVTGTPPFSLFQSEFNILSGALAADRGGMAFLFIAGVVTIFAGFLVHMSKLSLGVPVQPGPRAAECPWKLAAMVIVAAAVIGLGFWLPGPIYELVRQTTQIIGGAP